MVGVGVVGASPQGGSPQGFEHTHTHTHTRTHTHTHTREMVQHTETERETEVSPLAWGQREGRKTTVADAEESGAQRQRLVPRQGQSDRERERERWKHSFIEGAAVETRDTPESPWMDMGGGGRARPSFPCQGSFTWYPYGNPVRGGARGHTQPPRSAHLGGEGPCCLDSSSDAQH